MQVADTGARLLVVDDNKVNRLLLARSLETQGHRVELAENGRVALEMLRAGSFDLMLLDIEMPEMDGFEVLEVLKADSALSDVGVIVTSAVEHSSVLNYCLALEQDGYRVTYLPVDREGLLKLADLENAITDETAVVSLMWANNETGVVPGERDCRDLPRSRRALSLRRGAGGGQGGH